MMRNTLCYLLLYALASYPSHATALKQAKQILVDVAANSSAQNKEPEKQAFKAVEENNVESLQKYIIDGNIDVNITRRVPSDDEIGLKEIIKDGVAAIAECVAMQESVNTVSYTQKTRLKVAVYHYLWAKDMQKNINKTSSFQETLLEVAIKNALPSIVKFLVAQKGINMAHKDKNGNNYLHMACKEPGLITQPHHAASSSVDTSAPNNEDFLRKNAKLKREIVGILLTQLESLKKLEIYINGQNDDLDTPLSLAVCDNDVDGNVEKVTLLLEQGADPNTLNKKQETPFTKVVVGMNEKMFDVFLKDKKTNINQLSDEMAPVLKLFMRMFTSTKVAEVHLFKERIKRLLEHPHTNLHSVYYTLPLACPSFSSTRHLPLITSDYAKYFVLKKQKLNTSVLLSNKITSLLCRGYFKRYLLEKKNYYVGYNLIMPLVASHIHPSAIFPFFDTPVARINAFKERHRKVPAQTSHNTTAEQDDDDDIYN